MVKKQKTNDKDTSELIRLFSDTWLVLDAYDKETLATKGKTKKAIKLTASGLAGAVEKFAKYLAKKEEKGGMFGVERGKDIFEGIVGGVMQSFGGKEVYPTVEEKAANLFYFIVKNHPFVDGNKRGGAFSFVWLLHKAGILDIKRIPPSTLTALTLLVAESGSKEKDKIIQLVLTLLVKK
ncbi:MAG: Fic family protein [bacterium]|nr:Fic family protein [bacterium]